MKKNEESATNWPPHLHTNVKQQGHTRRKQAFELFQSLLPAPRFHSQRPHWVKVHVEQGGSKPGPEEPSAPNPKFLCFYFEKGKKHFIPGINPLKIEFVLVQSTFTIRIDLTNTCIISLKKQDKAFWIFLSVIGRGHICRGFLFVCLFDILIP